MKPYIHVKFADGSIFEVPTEVVAADRAAYYHERDKDEFPTLDDALKDTTGLFSTDAYEIEDWAKNNMNWDELAPHARLVGHEPPERDWSSSELSFHDAAVKIEPPAAGENLLRMPLDHALARVIAGRHICSVLPIGQDVSAPDCVLAVIQGGPSVTEFFMGGLGRLTEQLAAIASASTEGQTPN